MKHFADEERFVFELNDAPVSPSVEWPTSRTRQDPDMQATRAVRQPGPAAGVRRFRVL